MRWCVPFMAAIGLLLLPTLAQAQENDGTGTTVPSRPEILANRWQEDWSVLADPRVPREPFDGLKYIPLSLYDPKTYLSLGADFRERLHRRLNFRFRKSSIVDPGIVDPTLEVVVTFSRGADLEFASGH